MMYFNYVFEITMKPAKYSCAEWLDMYMAGKMPVRRREEKHSPEHPHANGYKWEYVSSPSVET